MIKSAVIDHVESKLTFEQHAISASDHIENILDVLPSGIIILNSDGIIISANPTAISLLDHPLIGEKWLTIINKAFAPQDDDGHEISLINGKRVKLALSALANGSEQLIVLTDLTETRLLQKNISHLQRLSALGKMVASLAHQVRTPLSSAILYASNLQSPKLNQQDRDKFQRKLLDGLNQLEHQVNDMLLMAKGKQNIMGEPILASIIINHVIGACEDIAAKKKVKIYRHFSSNHLILVNVNALTSAISNLVINSIEADATEIHIHACDKEKNVVLTVKDNGKGFDDSLQHQILAPFFTTKSQGTGLGLAVVQSIIKNHGGSINFHCQLHKGCEFNLLLPVYKKSKN